MWGLVSRSTRRSAQLAKILASLPEHGGGYSLPKTVCSSLVSLTEFPSYTSRYSAAAYCATVEKHAAGDTERKENSTSGRQSGRFQTDDSELPAANDEELYERLEELSAAEQQHSMIQLLNRTLRDWKSIDPRPQPSQATITLFMNSLLKGKVMRQFNADGFVEALHRDWGFPRSLELCNWLLQAHVMRRSTSDMALKLLRDMKDWEIEPNWETFVRAFSLCTVNKDSRSASRVLQQVEVKGLSAENLTRAQRATLASGLLNLAIAASKKGDIRDSVHFIKVQLEIGHPPQPIMVQEAMQTATEQGDPAAALDLLGLLRQATEKAGMPCLLDEGQCLMLLNCAATGESRQLATATWQLLKDSLAANSRPEVPRKPIQPCYHAYIHALAVERQTRLAFAAVAELQEAYPEVQHTWYTDLIPLVDGLASSPTVVTSSQRIIEDRLSQGEAVSTAITDCVLVAAGKVRDVNLAFELFDAFSELGLGPTTDTYAAVLNACVRNGMLDSVPMILQEWEAKGLPPNKQLWSEIVWFYIVARDAEGILAAINDMTAAGFNPSHMLLDWAVARLEREGHAEGVLDLSLKLGYNNWRNHSSKYKVARWSKIVGVKALTRSEAFVPRHTLLGPYIAKEGQK